MAKFYNKSKGYLWNNGFAYLKTWFVVLLFSYALFLMFHGPITSIGNDYLTIAWGIATLGLLVFWMRRGKNTAENHHSYILGYIAEFIVRKKLWGLSNDFRIIYDYKFKSKDSNIDFIIVCPCGVFAIEIKGRSKVVNDIYWQEKQSIAQVKDEARGIYNILNGHELKTEWVQPVLVFPMQKRYHRMENDNVVVLGRESIRKFFENYVKEGEEILSKEEMKKIVEVLITD